MRNTRSDCFVDLEISGKGGIAIDLSSKVGSLYGDSIRSLVRDVLSSLKIDHAVVLVEDRGAVPFVIAARVEAAVRRAIPETSSFLLPSASKQKQPVKHRLRRTRL